MCTYLPLPQHVFFTWTIVPLIVWLPFHGWLEDNLVTITLDSSPLHFSLLIAFFHTMNHGSPMAIGLSSLLSLHFPSVTTTCAIMASNFLLSLLLTMVNIKSYFSMLMVHVLVVYRNLNLLMFLPFMIYNIWLPEMCDLHHYSYLVALLI